MDSQLKNFTKLSDKELDRAATEISKEKKKRGNCKAAAKEVNNILKKYSVSLSDLKDFGLSFTTSTKGANKKKMKKTDRPADNRSRVSAKYKNPKGKETWTGRGRPPKWVNDIAEKKRLTINQFKSDKRYKV